MTRQIRFCGKLAKFVKIFSQNVVVKITSWLALQDLVRNPNKYIIALSEFNAELAKTILEPHGLNAATAG